MSHPPDDPHRLDYRSVDPPEQSQWITDQHAGNWLVGCLIALSVLGTIGGVAVAMLFFALGC